MPPPACTVPSGPRYEKSLCLFLCGWVGGFKKKNSVFLLFVSSYLPLRGLWAYGRLSAWLIAHSNPVPTPRPLRGRLINSDSLLRVLLLDSKFFYKSRSSSAAPPRLRCLLQLANKTTRRHVVFRFRSGRTNQNKSFGQAESPIFWVWTPNLKLSPLRYADLLLLSPSSAFYLLLRRTH